MELQQPISWRRNQQQVGQVVNVLVEQEHPGSGQLIGRSARFSADVDGLVYVDPGPPDAPYLSASPGTIVPVQITSADTYDLQGYLVNNHK